MNNVSCEVLLLPKMETWQKHQNLYKHLEESS